MGQIKMGQIKMGQIKMGQIKMGQIKMGLRPRSGDGFLGHKPIRP
jgi:hypothetical protein